MTPPIQRNPSPPDEPSPSSSGEPSASTNDGSVVQSVTQSFFHDAIHDTNQSPVSEEHISLYFTYPPSLLNQAISFLYTGIGIELWTLETIWPGIYQDLWWFNYQLPNMASDRRRFDCPVFVAEIRNGWQRTCNNYKGANMADVRRHLTTRPGRGYVRQLSFLELFTTCKEDFIDRGVFESQHGYKGEFCNNPKPGRRGDKAQVQWKLLYDQVEAAMWSQHLPIHQNEDDSTLPGPSAGLPVPSVLGNDVVESPVDPPIQQDQEDAIPHQSIVESDSDKREQETQQQHTSSLAFNRLNETPVPQAWPAIEHAWTNVFDQDPWAPQRIISRRSLESGGFESQIQPNTAQASSHDACTQVSETTLSLISDTTPSRTHNSIEPEGSTPAQNYQGSSRDPLYAELMKSMEQGSNEMLNNRVLSWRLSDSQITHPPEICSSVSTLSNEQDGSISSSSHTLCCPSPFCAAQFTGKFRRGNMKRHMRAKHLGTTDITCADCGRVFVRSDALLKHMRKTHPPHEQIDPNREDLLARQ